MFIMLAVDYSKKLTSIENGEHNPTLDSISKSIEESGFVRYTVVILALYMVESIVWPVSITYALYMVIKKSK